MTTRKSAAKLLEKYTGPVNFAMFVRAARTSMDCTQVEMAKKLGISKSVLCDIEKGRQSVSPKFALKIAKKAGLSERQAVALCLQDQLDKAKIKMKVQIAS